MNTELTLQEKLYDLRKEKGLKQEELAEIIGVSTATISRFETDENMNIAYQDLLKLAKFFDVSMDYLCGLTNHRKYRNTNIDDLALTDDAVDVLKSKKANNRLISELLALDDFIKLLSTIEIYIDGKISDGTNAMNATLALVEKQIQGNLDISDKNDILSTIKEAYIDENEYLRFRISEKFNLVLKQLFDSHKKILNNDVEKNITEKINDTLDVYFEDKNKPNIPYLKIAAKQMGIDLTVLNSEELCILEKILSNSEVVKQFKKLNYKKIEL